MELDTPNQELVSFPKNQKPSVTLKESDYKRLKPEVFLNDNIVDFALNFYLEKSGNESFLLFNSFFLSTLYNFGVEKVERWNKNIPIFQKKHWIIPVCLEEHWSLLVVRDPSRFFEKKNPQPAMIFLDSLDRSVPFLGDCMLEYIKHQAKLRGIYPRLFIPNTYYLQPKVPLQTNEFDCGVYLIQYAKYYIENHQEFKIINGKLRDFPDIFTTEEIEWARYYFRNVIQNLHSFGNSREGVYIVFKKPTKRKRPTPE